MYVFDGFIRKRNIAHRHNHLIIEIKYHKKGIECLEIRLYALPLFLGIQCQERLSKFGGGGSFLFTEMLQFISVQ